ncbi:hypothetical protein C3L33_22926, partial [Rhododendron williamsianum]
MWNCPYSTDYFEEFAEDFDDKDRGLSEVALGNGITIMHLFDINLPGDISLKEWDAFTAGDQPTIVDIGMHRLRRQVNLFKHHSMLKFMAETWRYFDGSHIFVVPEIRLADGFKFYTF